jgi:hypothetical protein
MLSCTHFIFGPYHIRPGPTLLVSQTIADTELFKPHQSSRTYCATLGCSIDLNKVHDFLATAAAKYGIGLWKPGSGECLIHFFPISYVVTLGKIFDFVY